MSCFVEKIHAMQMSCPAIRARMAGRIGIGRLGKTTTADHGDGGARPRTGGGWSRRAELAARAGGRADGQLTRAASTTTLTFQLLPLPALTFCSPEKKEMGPPAGPHKIYNATDGVWSTGKCDGACKGKMLARALIASSRVQLGETLA